jgi:hypothetical protein
MIAPQSPPYREQPARNKISHVVLDIAAAAVAVLLLPPLLLLLLLLRLLTQMLTNNQHCPLKQQTHYSQDRAPRSHPSTPTHTCAMYLLYIREAIRLSSMPAPL